ncbi:hypothetical protein TrCOL_g11690 [Triparma columacea]|uniref:Phosphoglucomutase n=1 Tax=Triparma columacea TaxID=722753 RepID=A0A9W7LBQ5_9STRA|nr:hypothetical protein TrCOL_g11690 [Triparma columacea]
MNNAHAAKEWASMDPNPLTRKYIEEATPEAIEGMFSKRIAFGTAGLRSKMLPGPANMNDLVIIQTAQGLAEYILSLSPPSNPTAVVGYDHRENPSLNLSSEGFAKLTKAVFDSYGISTTLLDGFVPTPLVPFAVKEQKASCGIMVTASHNPKEDDGYKVYWSNACQIVSPHDKNISTFIDANLTPKQSYDTSSVTADSALTESYLDKYFSCIESDLVLTTPPTPHPSSPLSLPTFVYTAMHGIGHPFTSRSFSTFSLPPFCPVGSQCDPDPTFPTVSFPNPEEKGALDEAMKLAEAEDKDIVLANDPDADRLAVAERDRATGTWTVFKGDQIGVLLGHWMWESFGRSAPAGTKCAMLASAVSSKMLKAVAEKEGFLFEETLTGFKWIGSRNLDLQSEGYKVLFSYEEAIGFCCGDMIVDKDGVSAAGVFAQMATHLYVSAGMSVSQHLQRLYSTYGEFVSNNGYFFCYDPAVVAKIISGIRNGGEYFKEVAGYEVAGIRDLGEPGYDSSKPDNKPTLPTSASSPMITISFTNGCVAQFRASGTEPKFKYYVEMAGKPGVQRSQVEEELNVMVDKLLETLLSPSANGLTR